MRKISPLSEKKMQNYSSVHRNGYPANPASSSGASFSARNVSDTRATADARDHGKEKNEVRAIFHRERQTSRYEAVATQ